MPIKSNHVLIVNFFPDDGENTARNKCIPDSVAIDGKLQMYFMLDGSNGSQWRESETIDLKVIRAIEVLLPVNRRTEMFGREGVKTAFGNTSSMSGRVEMNGVSRCETVQQPVW